MPAQPQGTTAEPCPMGLRHQHSACSGNERYDLIFIQEHHEPSSTWQNVQLKKLEDQIQPFRNEAGFEQIATALAIPRPQKIR